MDDNEYRKIIDELKTSRANLALVSGILLGSLSNIRYVLADEQIPLNQPTRKALADGLAANLNEFVNPILTQEFYPDRSK